MAQTKEGALLVAAKKIELKPELYRSRVKAGEKWCYGCRDWHPRYFFGKDKTRFDGLVPACREFKNSRLRKAYIPRPRPQKGRSFVPARDGDRLQARRRINYFVESGIMLHPNKLPCSSCGHVWNPGDTRHEYHHFKGYKAEHHEDVEALCCSCHHHKKEV